MPFGKVVNNVNEQLRRHESKAFPEAVFVKKSAEVSVAHSHSSASGKRLQQTLATNLLIGSILDNYWNLLELDDLETAMF